MRARPSPSHIKFWPPHSLSYRSRRTSLSLSTTRDCHFFLLPPLTRAIAPRWVIHFGRRRDPNWNRTDKAPGARRLLPTQPWPLVVVLAPPPTLARAPPKRDTSSQQCVPRPPSDAEPPLANDGDDVEIISTPTGCHGAHGAASPNNMADRVAAATCQPPSSEVLLVFLPTRAPQTTDRVNAAGMQQAVRSDRFGVRIFDLPLDAGGGSGSRRRPNEGYPEGYPPLQELVSTKSIGSHASKVTTGMPMGCRCEGGKSCRIYEPGAVHGGS